jgi:hypothetical protein
MHAGENQVVVLVLVYCLTSDHKACVENRLPFEGFASPVACVTAAQQRAQEYLVEHPKYRLDSWKCEVNVPQQTPT